MIPAKYWSPTKKLMVLGAMAGGKLVEDTATGNPLTFITNVSKPLKSLLIPFTPRQNGSGDPSPSNIRSILPWNGLTVFGGGKNLFKLTAVSKKSNGVKWEVDGDTIKVSGVATGYSAFSCGEVILPKTGEISVSGLYGTSQNVVWASALKDKNGNTVATPSTWYNDYTIDMADYPTAEKLFVEIKRNSNVATSGEIRIQVEVGTVTTAYEPYHPITETDIVFPSPVYGGTLDVVSGVLTVEWIAVNLSSMGFTYRSGWNCWAASADSRFETVASNNTPTRALTAEAKAVGASGYTSSHPANTFSQNTNGVWFFDNGSDTDAPEGYLIVPLATPTEQTLTGHQLTALIGNNTIWSDADGQMTAVYLKKG